MNAAEAEAYIKSQLDGHFFTLVFSREGHSEPRVSHTRVSPDYLPEYHLMPDETETAQKFSAQAEKKHRPWTDEEVKKLIVMRQAGTRWDYIAREIKRCNRAIKDRYRELEAELNLPKIATRQGKFSKLSDEQKAEILKRREDGEAFEQIELATNIPKYVVRDYYHRHLRAMKERRMAA
jgi:hypothetical protein